MASGETIASPPPVVSVIGLCYNHARFVAEALRSVCQQTYTALEMIVVDDASTDDSVAVIEAFLAEASPAFPVKKLFLPQNTGNCRAFNQGLALATGKYVIDFSTDDVMLPERIAQQVALFEQLPASYGVVFSEAAYIDEHGKHLGYHYQDKLRRLKTIPTGDVYTEVLHRYFICGPTMIVKKEVLDRMQGYDERLAYEDFDFWVRSSRHYGYAYLKDCTTQVRKLPGSLSTRIGKPGDRQRYATYLVCRKALRLSATAKEKKALIKRIQYELRQCIIYGNKREARFFLCLLNMLQGKWNVYALLYKLTGSGIVKSVAKRLKKQTRL